MHAMSVWPKLMTYSFACIYVQGKINLYSCTEEWKQVCVYAHCTHLCSIGKFDQSKILMFCKFLRDDYEGEKRMDDINSSKFPVGLTLAVCM